MKKKNRIWIFPILFILAAVGYDRVYRLFDPEFRNTVLIDIVTVGNQIITNKTPAILPYSIASTSRERYEFEGEIVLGQLAYPAIQVVPDDYLESVQINETNVPLEGFSSGKRGDFNNGLTLDLRAYLKKGTNQFTVVCLDKGKGRAGLEIKKTPALKNPLRFCAALFFLLFEIFCISAVLFPFIKDKKLLTIVLTGIAIHFYYLTYTPFDKNTYDILEGNTGHINYIEFIVNNHSLPRPDKGWEYHQPPLYYATSAVVYQAAKSIGIENLYKMLQGLSFLYFLGFVYFGIKTLSRIIPDKKWIYVSAALLVFWPSGFIHAVRIGNDSLVYFLSAACLYYTLIWRLEETRRSFIFALVFAGLSLMTKSSGLIQFALIGSVFLIRLFEKRDFRDFFVKTGILALVFAGAFLSQTGRNWYYAIKEGRSDWYLAAFLNNPQSVNSGLLVGNKPVNYSYFDLKTYLAEPYTSTWTDEGGRQYFWNFLTKSSLFGEFSFNRPYHRRVAFVLGILLLVLLIYLASGILVFLRGCLVPLLEKIRVFPLHPAWVFKNLSIPEKKRSLLYIKKDDFKRLDALLLFLFFSIASMLAFRIQIPFSCLADFRYILPVLIPCTAVLVWWLEKLRKKELGMLYIIGVYSALIFALLGGLFFLVISKQV